MEANLTAVLGAFLVLTPIVVGLTSVVKPLVNEKLVPLSALIIGVVIAYLGSLLVGGIGWSGIVLGGLVLGLSASGLYSGAKATVA